MRNLFVFALIFLALPAAQAQTMYEAMRAEWRLYAFVSTSMPRESLIQTAKDAQRSNAVIVLRGMGKGPEGMTAARDFASAINAECCASKPPAWQIHPVLFDRYKVKSAPAFVLAKGDGVGPDDFTIVSGDVGLAATLKFMAQSSGNSAVRAQAALIYNRSFASRY